jgi:hypothetical protein
MAGASRRSHELRSRVTTCSSGRRLTLAAAHARLGDLIRAKAAITDFKASVPGVETIAKIKKWIQPGADLSGYEPLYEGLRLAGLTD